MIITIVRPDLVMVDGVSFRVSLDGLDPRVEVLQFDTKKGVGEQHFSEGVTTTIPERDFKAEYDALASCIAKNQNPNALQPIYTQREVQRPPEKITSFDPAPFVQRWEQAKEAERQRRAALDEKTARGQASPKRRVFKED